MIRFGVFVFLWLHIKALFRNHYTGMTDYKQDEQRYQSYLRVHLKKDQLQLSPSEQIEALEKRDRSRWLHLLINIAAIAFFGYSFYFGITQLGQTFFIIIMAVFGINVGLILYQKRQIKDLIGYLKWRQRDN